VPKAIKAKQKQIKARSNIASLNVANFWAVSLFRQFRKVFNIFYLVVLLLKSLAFTMPLISIICFALSLMAQILREFGEEKQLIKQDEAINEQQVFYYNFANFSFERCKQSDISIGDFVMIKRGQTLPVDMLLMISEGFDTAFMD
jgi:magnesium-transporting ATPase (P-type)